MADKKENGALTKAPPHAMRHAPPSRLPLPPSSSSGAVLRPNPALAGRLPSRIPLPTAPRTSGAVANAPIPTPAKRKQRPISTTLLVAPASPPRSSRPTAATPIIAASAASRRPGTVHDVGDVFATPARVQRGLSDPHTTSFAAIGPLDTLSSSSSLLLPLPTSIAAHGPPPRPHSGPAAAISPIGYTSTDALDDTTVPGIDLINVTLDPVTAAVSFAADDTDNSDLPLTVRVSKSRLKEVPAAEMERRKEEQRMRISRMSSPVGTSPVLASVDVVRTDVADPVQSSRTGKDGNVSMQPPSAATAVSDWSAPTTARAPPNHHLDRLLLARASSLTGSAATMAKYASYYRGGDALQAALANNGDSDDDDDDRSLSDQTTNSSLMSIESMTSVLMDDADARTGIPGDDDVAEYALIEALNSAAGVKRMETMGMLTHLRTRFAANDATVATKAATITVPAAPAAVGVALLTTATSTVTTNAGPTEGAAAVTTPATAAATPPAPQLPLVSPLSIMDTTHLLHLGKVYGLSLRAHTFSLSLSALTAIRRNAVLSAGISTGPLSAATLAEAVVVRATFELPEGLGSREFTVDVRQTAIMRATASTLKKPEAGNTGAIPAIDVPINGTDAIALSFNAATMDAFIRETMQVTVQVSAKAPLFPRSGMGASAAAARRIGAGAAGSQRWNQLALQQDAKRPPAMLSGTERIKLVRLLQAHRFDLNDMQVPVFSSGADRPFLGTLQLSLGFLPTLPEAALAAMQLPPSPVPSPPPPTARGPLLAEPPFPVQLTLTINQFTPAVTPRGTLRTFSATGTSHSMRMHIYQSLCCTVRLHVALDTAPVAWTHRVLDQTPGVVMDQVSVRATVAKVDFDTSMSIPVCMQQLEAWADPSAVLAVEVWGLTETSSEDARTAAVDGNTANSSVRRDLVGLAKLPLGRLLETIQQSTLHVPWHQVLPLSLLDVEYAVVDLLSGETQGWLSAGIGIQPRSPHVLQQRQHEGVIESTSGGAADANPTPPLPSACLLVRVHEASGLWSLAEHVATHLLNAPDMFPSPTPMPFGASAGGHINSSSSLHHAMFKPPLPVPQAISPHHRAALFHLLHSRSLNPICELAALPRSLAKRVGANPDPIRTAVAWRSCAPRWDMEDAGHECVLSGMDEPFLQWMESPNAVAHGRIWHRFAAPSDDAQLGDGNAVADTAAQGTAQPLADLLIGEFHVPLSRLVKRSSGLRDTWAPVYAPERVGPESGIVGLGTGQSIPPLSAMAAVHFDMGFTDTIEQPLAEFLPVDTELTLFAQARTTTTKPGQMRGRYVLSWDAAQQLPHSLNTLPLPNPRPQAAPGDGDTLHWEGAAVFDALAVQKLLNGSFTIQVQQLVMDRRDDGSFESSMEDVGHAASYVGGSVGTASGFAHIDTFTLAHAVLRFAHGGSSSGSDRISFRVPVMVPDSATGSDVWISGWMQVRKLARAAAERFPSSSPTQKVPPANTTTAPSPLPQARTHVRHAVDPPPQQPLGPMCHLEVRVREGTGFSVSRPTVSTAMTISFAWSADADLDANSFGSSVLSVSENHHHHHHHHASTPAAAERTTYTMPHAPLVTEESASSGVGANMHVTWDAPVQVPQSLNPSALERLQRKKVIVFKLWQTDGATGGLPEESERLVGYSRVDIAPLAHGLDEIDGWYDIVDFHGVASGQLRVSIRPSQPLGPVFEAPMFDRQHRARSAADAAGPSSAYYPLMDPNLSSSTSLSLDILSTEGLPSHHRIASGLDEESADTTHTSDNPNSKSIDRAVANDGMSRPEIDDTLSEGGLDLSSDSGSESESNAALDSSADSDDEGTLHCRTSIARDAVFHGGANTSLSSLPSPPQFNRRTAHSGDSSDDQGELDDEELFSPETLAEMRRLPREFPRVMSMVGDSLPSAAADAVQRVPLGHSPASDDDGDDVGDVELGQYVAGHMSSVAISQPLAISVGSSSSSPARSAVSVVLPPPRLFASARVFREQVSAVDRDIDRVIAAFRLHDV
ncbi:hypothetical protein BC828DRAFT_375606 [Blastocladiella britannica]|nr:hypothetical protein BC828DRAFT_375606 [Blastocladiella britannica]